MISLMTMHSSNNVDYQLIVLNFSPYLRTFLHRYDLYESHYWSVFDEIQGVGHQTPKLLIIAIFHGQKALNLFLLPFQIQAITGDNTFSKNSLQPRGVPDVGRGLQV